MSPSTSSQVAATGAALRCTALYTCCQERGATASSAAAATVRAAAAQRGDLRAVSYTHLRAHETSAHL
eukprot:2628825-Alexandrium_andersonii.AAC.1